MEFDHVKARRVVEEDRLSSLPDELIHKILSSFDMKFVVQTCLLSSRWKLLWTSVPCLNFSSNHFRHIRKFAKFVTHVLSHRNHQIQVSLVKLDFRRAANQDFVEKIANFAFSHNVPELTVVSSSSTQYPHPPCLFISQSLKHFKFVCTRSNSPKTPLDFPSLITMHLGNIRLCDELFSKCVNLKNLTLENFSIKDMEVFDIITPRLSNLMLIDGLCSKVINVIAPQLENLTIIHCSLKYLNTPPGLSSLCYTFDLWSSSLQFSNDQFHFLNKVTICLSAYYPKLKVSYRKEDAHKIINMLQQLHSARYLTLNADIIECLSLFPKLLMHHPSPFSNLICLTIDYSMRKRAYKVPMSSEVRNFLLENSPSAEVQRRR